MRKRAIAYGILLLALGCGAIAVLRNTGWIGAVEVPIVPQVYLKVPATLSVIETGSFASPIQVQDKNTVIGGINCYEAADFFAQEAVGEHIDVAKTLCDLLGVSVPGDAAMMVGGALHGDLEMTLSYPDEKEICHYFFFQEDENTILDVWVNASYVNTPFGLQWNGQ